MKFEKAIDSMRTGAELNRRELWFRIILIIVVGATVIIAFTDYYFENCFTLTGESPCQWVNIMNQIGFPFLILLPAIIISISIYFNQKSKDRL